MAQPSSILSAGFVPSTPDETVEYQKLVRRMRAAEALQQSSMTPLGDTQFAPGGMAVKRSPFEGLAKVAQAYAGRKMQDEVDRTMTTMATGQQDRLRQLAERLYEAMTPIPGIEAPSDELGGGPGRPDMPGGDKRKAMALLLAYPEYGKLAAQAQMKKLFETDKPIALGRDQRLVTGAGQQIVAPMADKPKQHVINGKVFEAGDGRVTELGGPGQQAKPGEIPYKYSDLTPAQAREADERARKAGAISNNVSVNTEKSFLGNMAEAVGKGVAGASDQARAAVGTINTVNQIREAMDTGKVIAGPGTTARVFLGQVGQVIGVGGKDANEQLTNTRQAIQGLAQLELDAAQQMRGQGQITEAERAIIRRAASGDIDGMTGPELRTLMNSLERTARSKIATNRSNVERLNTNPNARSFSDFMSVPEPPAYQSRQPAPAAGGGLVEEARQAIQRGAPRDAVIQRLESMGVRNHGL